MAKSTDISVRQVGPKNAKKSIRFAIKKRRPVFLWGGTQRIRFQQTQFIAVTHYQNERITALKKNYNPHAKGYGPTLLVSHPAQSNTKHPTYHWRQDKFSTTKNSRLPASSTGTSSSASATSQEEGLQEDDDEQLVRAGRILQRMSHSSQSLLQSDV